MQKTTLVMCGEKERCRSDLVVTSVRRQCIGDGGEVSPVDPVEREPERARDANARPCPAHVPEGPVHELASEVSLERRERRPAGLPEQDDDALSALEAPVEQLGRQHVIAGVALQRADLADGTERLDLLVRPPLQLRRKFLREDGREERLLALEVPVDVPRRDACPLRDRRDRRALVSNLREERRRRCEDLVPHAFLQTLRHPIANVVFAIEARKANRASARPAAAGTIDPSRRDDLRLRPSLVPRGR
jgi:hypothetical protein